MKLNRVPLNPAFALLLSAAVFLSISCIHPSKSSAGPSSSGDRPDTRDPMVLSGESGEENESDSVSSPVPSDAEADSGAQSRRGYTISSLEDLFSRVSGSLESFMPLRRRGRLVGWIRDINSDGNDDAVFICLEKDADTDELGLLGRDIRIYDDAYPLLEYAVVAFLSNPASDNRSASFSKQVTSLGAFRSIRNVKELDLSDPLPFAVELQMFTETSSVKSWVLFKDGISVIPLKESPKHGYEITDIDRDGIIDIIISERFFEEGAGEETFLSWYKWNGSTFSEYSSTNVVRNLNSFLSQISYVIEHRNWDRFYRYALSNRIQRNVLPGGTGRDRLFSLFFKPSGHPGDFSLDDIRDIRFQDILENPFSEDTRQIEITCRITLDQEYFYSVIVQQSRNPFIQPQFFLLPVRSF